MATPTVEHMREVRGPLLLKLALLERLKLDAQDLLAAQVIQFEPPLQGLERSAAEPLAGFEHTLASWRLVSARGVMEFLNDRTVHGASV